MIDGDGGQQISEQRLPKLPCSLSDTRPVADFMLIFYVIW